MLKCDDRFARQNRGGPPPEFPLASPSSSIVHHLSGPIGRAPTGTVRNRPPSVNDAPPTPLQSGWLSFLCSLSLSLSALICRGLARTLDSLVRVSRRVRCGRNRSASLALDVERAVGRASEFTERLARPSTRATLYEHLFKTAGDDGRRRRTGRLVAPRSEFTSTHAGPRHPFNGRARPHGL